LAISKTHNLLFSCSNDKTINIWQIPSIKETNRDNTISSKYLIHSYQNDYIKSLCYNEEQKFLYSCSYDGTITQFNIEEFRKTNKIKFDRGSNILYEMGEQKSIFSIDCDISGKLLLASVYENVKKN
jgi:WD40 repeat protein